MIGLRWEKLAEEEAKKKPQAIGTINIKSGTLFQALDAYGPIDDLSSGAAGDPAPTSGAWSFWESFAPIVSPSPKVFDIPPILAEQGLPVVYPGKVYKVNIGERTQYFTPVPDNNNVTVITVTFPVKDGNVDYGLFKSLYEEYLRNIDERNERRVKDEDKIYPSSHGLVKRLIHHQISVMVAGRWLNFSDKLFSQKEYVETVRNRKNQLLKAEGIRSAREKNQSSEDKKPDGMSVLKEKKISYFAEDYDKLFGSRHTLEVDARAMLLWIKAFTDFEDERVRRQRRVIDLQHRISEFLMETVQVTEEEFTVFRNTREIERLEPTELRKGFFFDDEKNDVTEQFKQDDLLQVVVHKQIDDTKLNDLMRIMPGAHLVDLHETQDS